MSSILQLQRNVNGVATDAYSVTIEIDRVDSGVAVVAAGTATVHAGTGLYTYDYSALDQTLPYKATWTITPTDGATADVVTELVDPQSPALCTMAQIERELASRVGPFWTDTVYVQRGDPSKINTLYQTSTIPLGGWKDLWVMRRGVMAADGSAINGFVDSDRERRVKADPDDNGDIQIDRAYSNPPIEGEEVEFHSLQPTFQLRKSVLRGLHRVKFIDRTAVQAVSPKAERDLTALCPWITQEEQVLGLQLVYPGAIYVPTKAKEWGAFYQDSHVWIWCTPDPYPYRLLISHWRRADSLVNGSYSSNYGQAGVAKDNDGLHIDVTWAAAAAHCEAWRYCGVTLLPASRTGLYSSRKDASEEFTRCGREFVKVPATPWQLGVTRTRHYLQAP
ncbi:MAG: hypothetical protein KGJ86_00240 [Chloroflexota bacterium]|nr:hypothetical protein [Chloroflexota bacterium]